MIPIRGVNFALLRAEKHITDGLSKSWKDSFDDDTIDALRTGLYAAYVYGKIGMAANLLRYGRKPKVRFSSRPFLEIVNFILAHDKDVLKRLTVNARISREVLDNIDAIFSPHLEAVQFLNWYVVQLAHVEEQAFKEAVSKYVQETLQQGMSEQEATEYLASKIEEFKLGRIHAIARTEATRAYNIGNLDEAYHSQAITKYEYIAVLDERTTEICRTRNGLIIDANDISMVAQNTPPLHVNCRSMLSGITVYEDSPPPANRQEWENLPSPDTRDTDVQMVSQLLSQWR